MNKVGRLTRVTQVGGVDIYVHWGVFVIAALIVMRVQARVGTTVAAVLSYFAILVIHETGHLLVARRLEYEAFSMTLYPIFGLARYEAPDTRFDHALIAWGGVAAQVLVAIPLVLFSVLVGDTRFGSVNAIVAVLGNYSLLVAAFNLLPFRPLDGSIAWGLIPAYFARKRLRETAGVR
jgi:Zn-dependent protease